jgi:hypothetical protein
MLIAVVNQSKDITNEQAYQMALLVNFQLRQHVAPAWGLIPPTVAYYPPSDGIVPGTAPKLLPPGSGVIGILDNSDQEGVLGYHSENQGGILYGDIFAQPVLSNGGNALTDDLSVCSVLSHEACELFLDPACDLWADAGNGTAYARELCDAVESDSYVVRIQAASATVTGTVSDFLLPPWFDPEAATNSHCDYLGLTAGPFQVRSTGYTLTETEGQVSQTFGELYPAWRRSLKTRNLARTARRLRQGSGCSGRAHA